MKKRFLLVFLAICLIMALLPMVALADGDTYGTDAVWAKDLTTLANDVTAWTATGNYDITWHTGDSPYHITDAADLAGLAVLVNGLNGEAATDFSGEQIILDQDINLSAHSWTPIGTVVEIDNEDVYYAFKGVFDGNDKAITGLNVPYRNDYYYIGFFGHTNGAEIRNLTITDCSVMGGMGTGSLVGYAQGTVIQNCQASGTVCGYNNVGGLVAHAITGATPPTIANCSFTGTVISGHGAMAGGLVGESSCNIENCFAAARVSGNQYTGGLVGKSLGTISGSYATGDAYGGFGICGGLVGRDEGTITGSYATGNVYAAYLAGGLVGGTDSGTEIADCYAVGNVFSQWGFAGGLVGENNGAISSSYAVGDITSHDYYAGGIVGGNNSTVTSCVALSKSITGITVGEMVGKNLGTLTNDWYLSGMNLTGGSVDFDDTGVNEITAGMETTPAFYSGADFMNWDVYGVAADPVWYCVDGTYPQLQPIAEATVTIEGTGFSVYADGKPINSGDPVFTGTKLELNSSREGYAVNSFVLEYEELGPLVDNSTFYESVSGNSFILRDDVTIRNITDEDQVFHAGQGDIWVYGDYYVIWGSEDLNDDGAIDISDFAIRYAEAEDFYAVARPMDPGHPITSYGVAVNQNLYQLGGGLLYFGNLNLGSGGLYGFGDSQGIYLESGILRAAEIDVSYYLWLETGTTTIVTGDITADDEVYSYGCNLEVGGNLTTGDDVYFDSDSGPLFVTVHGDIITESSYEQGGGSVRVDGNIVVNGYEDEDDGRIYCDIYCMDDYAHYNATELSVGGDLIARHEAQLHLDQVEGETIQLGNVVIGEEDEINTGSLDTASNDSASRHSKKTASDEDEIKALYVADSNEPLTDLEELNLVTVRVGGSIIAGREIEIYGGNVKVANTIQTLSEQEAKTIYIYGGKIEAGNIVSATRIVIDESGNDFNLYDVYEINDPIELHVKGNMTAQYEIEIYSGKVDVDGTIRTLSDIRDTIYLYGGTITAGSIASATDLYIGEELDGYGRSLSADPSVTVAGSISAAGNLYFYSGIISAAAISFDSDGVCIIEDEATLLDAVNRGTVAPVNGYIEPTYLDVNTLYRTTLSGLIPGALMDISISNSLVYSPGSKQFTAAADQDGCIYVWLLEGETVAGTASVYSEDGNELNATGSIGADADNELNFGSATPGVSLVKIGLAIPDTTYKFSGLPWENNPYDPANWTFTTLDGTMVEGFSGECSDYDCTIYRNGLPYDYMSYPSLLAGDYTVYVSTTQDITDGELTTTYVAAGSASFTIAQAIVAAKADDQTVMVGDPMPNFDLTYNDYSDVLDGNPELDYLYLFYGDCFGTTAVRGSYPIYTRMNCTGDYGELYASYLQEVIDLDDSFGFDIQDGVLTVRSTANSSGGSLLTYYAITATAGAGGSITPSGNISVQAGADKTFTIKADTGYKISDVLVNGKSVGAVSTYTIKNIAKDTTIEAKFVLADAVVNPFSDVPEGAWYYDAVNFVAQKGLFKGTSDTTFEPGAPVTRAMFVTTLGRLHKVDEAAYSGGSFSDVPAGEWYSAYVEWAAKNGIAKGYSDGTFGPDKKITREELCAILSRYCDYAGIKLPQTAAPADFADSARIEDWARDYVKSVQMADLVRGMENNLFQPKGDADRAQVAMILMRLILNVLEA